MKTLSLNKDLILVLSLAIICQIIALYHSPIRYECDAASYYSIAQNYITFLKPTFDSYRPHLFPLFIVLTGQFLFHSFWGTILGHSVLSVVSVVLVYRMLFPIHRYLGLLTSLVFCGSFIPFTATTLMLAEQLFMFNIIATYYFLSRFIFSRKIKYQYLTALFGLFAMFTRWEGQFVLIGSLLGLFFYSIKTRFKPSKLLKENLKHFTICVGLVLMFLGWWSYKRCVYLNDFSQFGKIQGGTAQQLFWRIKNDLPDHKLTWNNIINQWGKKSEKIVESSPKITNLISVNHGPKSKKAYDTILSLLEKDPLYFKKYEGGMHSLNPANSKSTDELYYEHYGKFGWNPKRIVDNFFAEDNLSLHYVFHIGEFLKTKLGPKESENLIQEWMFETVLKNPWIFLNMIGEGLSMFVVSFPNTLSIILNKELPILSSFSSYWEYGGEYFWFYMDFNLSNCTKQLPTKQFEEHKKNYDRFLTKKTLASRYHKVTSILRNMTRNILGPLLLLTWLFLFFNPVKIFYFSLSFGLLGILSVVATLGSGVGTRYEYATLPLIIILSMCGMLQVVKNEFFKK